MFREKKYQLLIAGIIFDAIGMSSFALPFIGELSDIIWAPASAWLMSKMYKGTQGKIASTISFIEEAIPGLDFIPTFTLMWLYTFVWKKSPTPTEPTDTIDAEVVS